MKNAILWKRVLNGGCIYDLPDNKSSAFLRDVLASPMIVDSRTGDTDKTIDWRAFSHMAIPFMTVWIEGQVDTGQLWGVLIRFSDLINGTREAECYGVVSGVGGQCCIGYCVFPIDEQGSITGIEGEGVRTNGVLSRHMLSQYGRDYVWQALTSTVSLAFDVLRLCGCKNVSLESRDNDPKEVRRATKRHGVNSHGYRYHVLVVRPPGARHDSPAQEIGVMPRHVCRGHFAEYGPEFNKGMLFGKYSGRFFIPPHMKGRKENGEVAKDYEIGGAT